MRWKHDFTGYAYALVATADRVGVQPLHLREYPEFVAF
jgi:hypothetical protein